MGRETLTPEQLYTRCDAAQFSFSVSTELEPLTEIIGQTRASEALQFGIKIKHKGYHIFVHGPAGVGKHTFVRQSLELEASHQPTPPDWCYVIHFEQPHKPNALKLPSGRGHELQQDMQHLVEELHNVIPAAFDSEQYNARSKEKEDQYEERRDKAYSDFSDEAKAHDVKLIRTPAGYVLTPLRDGKALSPEMYRQLPEKEREHFDEVIAALQEQLSNLVRQEPKWQREFRDDMRHLNQDVATLAVAHLIEDLKNKYQDVDEVGDYLDQVQQDVVQNVDMFLARDDNTSVVPQDPTDSPTNRRYQVNLIVDNRETVGAPVVYEDTPTYENLVGRVEHMTHMGTLVTDFMLIKPGALHCANGGYLMLDANKLLMQPFAWEALKRALNSRELKIQSLGQLYSLISTSSLEPEPIPLNIKVVLIGDRLLFYLLNAYDSEFAELFKVAADFEEQVDRTPENNLLYARLIATIASKEGLFPFTAEAVARIIEFASRNTEDSQKLSTHMRSLSDLLTESDYWCKQQGAETVSHEHVQRAIDQQNRRVDRMRENVYEEIERGTILIDVKGSTIGQVNGLSIIDLGNFSFAQPARITATVSLGEGEIIDIEREVELGGPIHSKGVFILSAFLSSRFAIHRPLSINASLVFEQSYGGIEGDSASVAELCALLSALGKIPLKQSLAITGSVNQHGQVQVIGGVNEKIEGFFDVCARLGLTGEQGVLIPAGNVKHLMLKPQVVTAVKEKRFHVYPIETIDQAIALLTGLTAGEPDRKGKYTKGSVYQQVNASLEQFAQRKLEFSGSKTNE